jgi:hypothetical protein
MLLLRVPVPLAGLTGLNEQAYSALCGSLGQNTYIRSAERSPEDVVSEHPMDDLDLDLDELGSALPEPETLSTRILKSLCHGTSILESSNGSVSYLAEGRIGSIITQKGILQELQRSDRCRVSVTRQREPTKKSKPCPDSELKDLSDWIHHHAKKTFAISLYCTLEEANIILAMIRFRRRNFGDDKLPIGESVGLVNASVDVLNLFPAKIWQPVHRRRFFDDQWKFIVPVFTQEKYDYDLNPNDIFPFTVDSSTLPKVGGFGAVHKVHFHEEHQKNQRMRTVSFSKLNASIVFTYRLTR